MRKVIKILLKLIPTAILLLIFVPLMLSVLLTIPVVQNRVRERAVEFASEYMGTTVDIKKINVGAFGQLIFSGLYIEDYQRDTLLFADRVDIHILKIGIQSREIKFGSSKITGGEFHLRQGADSVMNIKPIVARLTPEIPAQKSMVISFSTLEVEEFDLHIDLLQHRAPDYGVDYGDMELQNMSARLDNFTIDGPAIHASIERFAFEERSGFELLDLTGDLYLSLGVVSIEDMVMDSRYSHLNIPTLSIVGASWSDYRYFVERVDIGVELQNSTLSSDDVAYFAPRMRDWGVSLTNINATGEGEVNDLRVNIKNSYLEDGSAVAVNLQMKGLPNIEKTLFTAKIKELVATPADITSLYIALSGEEFPKDREAIIEHLEEVRCSGEFTGRLSDFATSLNVTSALGGVQTSLAMSSGEQGRIIEGQLMTEDFDVGRLLNSSDVGMISLNGRVRGSVDDIMLSSSAQGVISRVVVRGESYHNITYGGWLNGGEMHGEAHSQNHGLDFDFVGDIDLSAERRGYDLDIDLRDIDLKKLKVNRRDSISRLSAHITALGSGNTIDDAVGRVTILDGEYLYNTKSLVSDSITLVLANTPQTKKFEIGSKYLDVEYNSKNSYKESWDYLHGVLRDYLPALYSDQLPDTQIDEIETQQGQGEYSTLSIDIKDLTPLADAFTNDMEVSKDSRLDVQFNTRQHDISLDLKSQYVELNSVLAIGLDLNVSTVVDSLTLKGSISEFLVGTRQFDNLTLKGGAKDNNIHLDAGYNDTDSLASASIEALATISNDPLRGHMAKVRLLPSQISQGAEMWNVKAKTIEIDKNGVLIDQFKIQNEEQELLVEGLASKSTSDTLRVDMQHFDLSIFSSITEALGYNVEGYTNGDIVVSSALYNMRVEANVSLDSVSVNTLPAPPMKVRAEWDFEKNQARVSLTDRIKGDTLIRGFFIPSKVMYYGRMDVDSLHLGLLNAPLKGILSNTTGYADARLTISGERRAATLEGYIDIKDMEAKVDYTNVSYRVPSVRIDVKENELMCRNAVLYDPLGNKGLMTLSVDLQHLSNIAYKVRLNVEDLMALNTTLADNDLFYGKMFASGVVDLVGDKVGVNMDITATTRDNSEFFMPLSSKSNISTAEFITFVSPRTLSDSTGISAVKQRFFDTERRNRAGGGSNLNINMSLNVTPEADFQLVIDPTVGDVIRGRGEGRLNIRVNPKSNIFDMYGDYTITEGNYLFTLRNIINKRFIINPGSTIQWTGDPLDALLDIEAVYKLKTSLQPLISDESTRSVPVDCTIYLKDRLMQPEVSFGISLPTGDAEQQAIISNLLNDQETISRQFFYLMLANSFISESATGSTSDLGVSTTAATGFELLTNQLSNWLSSSNYNVVIRYRPESELTGDELDFGISRSLINNRLLLEVEGNYSNDISSSGESEETASNFAGEAYITWLIDRSGALRLRGFTQTIDTYDENQGLQETGVGIYYKESFDNFKDLKARVKARFSRKGVGVRNKDDDDDKTDK
ncbi:MAG: translocation/assembly module TamB domain-containing protein [Rikenellaceae bacterium]